MKTRNVLSFTFLIITLFINSCGNKTTSSDGKLEGYITISGGFAMYPLAVKWAEEFKKINPDVRIDISAGGTGKGIADVLSGNISLAMVSRGINEEEVKKGAFGIAVSKDAVLPTINQKNPVLAEIIKTGVKKEKLEALWITQTIKTWGEVVNTNDKTPVQVFTRSDAGGAPETWAKFFGKSQEDLKGTGIFGDPGVANAVKGDIAGIGFNNAVYVYDLKTKGFSEGIRPLPIDIDGNGILDPNEDFYQNVDSLEKAVADGRYPSPPARDSYFVTKGKPTDAATIAFLNYVLTDGQKFVSELGSIVLPADRIEVEKAKLK